MKLTLVNLTGHLISLIDDRMVVVKKLLPVCSKARIITESERLGMICDWPIGYVHYKDIIGLPEPKEGTYYVVSSTIAREVSARGVIRTDLLIPSTIKDSRGEVIGCDKLNIAQFKKFD